MLSLVAKENNSYWYCYIIVIKMPNFQFNIFALTIHPPSISFWLNPCRLAFEGSYLSVSQVNWVNLPRGSASLFLPNTQVDNICIQQSVFFPASPSVFPTVCLPNKVQHTSSTAQGPQLQEVKTKTLIHILVETSDGL